MIIGILVIGLVLRLINLNQSLWWDEAINVVYAKNNDLWFYLTKYLIGDFHPPGWFFILWIWTYLLGFSEVIARLPSVIFGVSTIYLTYLMARKITERLGLISAALMSIAPLHIYYSQEARPYAFGAFAAAFSSYWFLRYLESKNFRNLVIFSLSIGLIFYSDYPVYFLFFAQLAFILINKKVLLFKFIQAIFLGLLLFLPFVIVLGQQLISGLNTAYSIKGWAEVVGGSDIKNIFLLWVKMLIGRIDLQNQNLYLLVIGFVSIAYLAVLFKLKLRDIKQNYYFYWLAIPPLVGILVSFFIPVFSYFRFLYILPAFYILLAIGLSEFNGLKFTLLLLIIVFLQLFFSLSYLLNPSFHREDWKGAVEFLDKQGQMVLFENFEVPAPVRYYSKRLDQAIPTLKKVPAFSAGDLKLNIEGLQELYLVEYLVDVIDSNRVVEKELEKKGFIKNETFNFRGVGFIYHYIK